MEMRNRRAVLMEFDLSKPQCYWFKKISEIPRGSRNEKAVSDFVVKFAEERNLKVKQDAAWNVIVDKPGSPGHEYDPVLILQAHMDMVCEKTSDSDHDFEKDPLDLYVEKGWLHARGTTLGGDDGNGVAYMLAVLDDDTLVHPPLECMFTTAEEIGLVGAQKLVPEDLHGDRLISLDGGGEHVTGLSSSGAATIHMSYEMKMEPASDPAYELYVYGLKGGHSAAMIDRERANALKLAARILEEAEGRGISLHLVSLDGGRKDNAITRESRILFTSSASYAELESSVKQSAAGIHEELQYSDEGFAAELKQKDSVSEQADGDSSAELLDFLYLIPDGFQHKSMAIPGLTLTSLNLGILYTDGNKAEMQILARSAIDSALDHMIGQVKKLSQYMGVQAQILGRYKGWNYKEDSDLRKKFAMVLEKHGEKLECHASHGGLECGIFSGMRPGIDIITFGPICLDVHSPEERLDLASFDRSYEMLREMITACAEQESN